MLIVFLSRPPCGCQLSGCPGRKRGCGTDAEASLSQNATITSTLASQYQLGGTPSPASAIHQPRNAWANPAREASVSQNL